MGLVWKEEDDDGVFCYFRNRKYSRNEVFDGQEVHQRLQHTAYTKSFPHQVLHGYNYHLRSNDVGGHTSQTYSRHLDYFIQSLTAMVSG